jgi:hypothetical protein
MKSLWPRVRPLLAKVQALRRFVMVGSGTVARARSGQVEAARLSRSWALRSGGPVSLAVSSVPSRLVQGGKWLALDDPGQDATIERAVAPPGVVPAAGDGRAARLDACTLRRDASHVRTHSGLASGPPPGRAEPAPGGGGGADGRTGPAAGRASARRTRNARSCRAHRTRRLDT